MWNICSYWDVVEDFIDDDNDDDDGGFLCNVWREWYYIIIYVINLEKIYINFMFFMIVKFYKV